MAFDDAPGTSPIPATFGELYVKWRKLHGGGESPLLEFVVWVETRLGRKIGDLATEADMTGFYQQLVKNEGVEVADMLFEGMEGGP